MKFQTPASQFRFILVQIFSFPNIIKDHHRAPEGEVFDTVQVPYWPTLTTFGTDYILVLVCWFSSFQRHFNLGKQVKLVVSEHFLKNIWEEWAEIWHADVSWPP